MNLKPIRTSPYTPSTNGKAERFMKTLLGECAYAMPFSASEKRYRRLPRYLELYSRSRCHMALVGLNPKQRLQLLHAEYPGEKCTPNLTEC